MCVVDVDVLPNFTWILEDLSLVHTSAVSTSTNARHTHAQKWFGSWMTDSMRAYAWRLCMCLSH